MNRILVGILLLITACSPCKEDEFLTNDINNVCLQTEDESFVDFVEHTLSLFNTDFNYLSLDMSSSIKEVDETYSFFYGEHRGTISGFVSMPREDCGPCKIPPNAIYSTPQSLGHEFIHLKIFIDSGGVYTGGSHDSSTGWTPELAARELAIEALAAEFYPYEYYELK